MVYLLREAIKRRQVGVYLRGCFGGCDKPGGEQSIICFLEGSKRALYNRDLSPVLVAMTTMLPSN